MPAKRKLNFTTSSPAKKLMAATTATSASAKAKKTFGQKVKSIILKNTETKRFNAATIYFALSHNAVELFESGAPSAAGCHMANLLYNVRGTDSKSREGDEIFVSKIHVKVRLSQLFKEIAVAQVANYCGNKFHCRCVVYECDSSDASDTTAPTDLFQPAGLNAMSNKVHAFLNTAKYQIRKDTILTMDVESEVDGGDIINGHIALPTTKIYNFTIPINKKFKYVGTTQYRPERQIGICLVGWNTDASADNGDYGQTAQVTWMSEWKDV